METGSQPETGKGLLAVETLPNQPEHGHLSLGPLDAPLPLGREAEIGDVVAGQA